MKEQGVAEALLRERLPPALVARFAGPPELSSESFVDETFRGSLADVVLRVKLRGGDDAYVFCLVEHKRTAERWVLVQVLRYVTALYAHLAKSAGGRPLPAVVPLIIYNGRTRWRGPVRFSELVDLPASLRHLTLDFEVLLVDLGAEPLAAVSAHPTLRGGLLALKAAATPAEELDEVLTEMIASLEGESTLGWFLEYLGEVGGKSLLPSIARVKREFENKERTMQTLNQYLEGRYKVGLRRGLKTGMKTGLRTGLKTGFEQGAAKANARAEVSLRRALRFVLRARFQRVPTSVREQIADAEFVQLEKWLRALTAGKSLKTVFSLS